MQDGSLLALRRQDDLFFLLFFRSAREAVLTLTPMHPDTLIISGETGNPRLDTLLPKTSANSLAWPKFRSDSPGKENLHLVPPGSGLGRRRKTSGVASQCGVESEDFKEKARESTSFVHEFSRSFFFFSIFSDVHLLRTTPFAFITRSWFLFRYFPGL